jgi:hypothetical protein
MQKQEFHNTYFELGQEWKKFGCYVLKRNNELNSSRVCVLLEEEGNNLEKEYDEFSDKLYQKTKEVCETQEFDEINMGCEEKCITKPSWKEAEQCLKENNCRGFSDSISKEDLTKEWLDENKDECFDLKDLRWYNQTSPYWNDLICSKYKLNDYTIEVIK